MFKIAKKTRTVARLGLGLVLVVFGLNGFFEFIPMAPPEGAAGQFLGGLAAAGYVFPLVKLIEIAVGLALLSGRLVPLALVVLAPITVNIVGFHLMLAPAGLGLAVVMLVAHVYLAWTVRAAYRPLFDTAPASATAASASPRVAMATR